MKTNQLYSTLIICLASFYVSNINAQKTNYQTSISFAADKIESKVIAWRHDIHEHPELGNREVRTADLIAKHLKSLGIEIKTGVGITGVVGILKGDKPGPVVALRADMDALPVEEKNNLPFASKVKTMYNGKETSVMHACGHDAYYLSFKNKKQLVEVCIDDYDITNNQLAQLLKIYRSRYSS